MEERKEERKEGRKEGRQVRPNFMWRGEVAEVLSKCINLYTIYETCTMYILYRYVVPYIHMYCTTYVLKQ